MSKFLFLPGFRVVNAVNDAITFVLASPSLLPFQGKQVHGTLHCEVKLCKRDESRGRVLPQSSWVLPGKH